MQLRRIGMENTTDMKRPLLSKYCCLENRVQFRAATSFIFSEKYTRSTEKQNEVTLKYTHIIVDNRLARELGTNSGKNTFNPTNLYSP